MHQYPRTRTPIPPILVAIVATLLLSGMVFAATVTNSATGSAQGIPLDPAGATVNLDRVGGVVSSALAEIAPNAGLTAQVGQSFVYDVMPTIGAGDTGVQMVSLTVPAGFANPVITGVSVGGAALTSGCPSPSAGQYCATIGPGTIDFLFGSRVTVDQTPIQLRLDCDTPATAGTYDFVATLVDGAQSAATLPGDADGDPGDANSISVTLAQTQGLVLQVEKTADKNEVLIGDVVTYSIVVRNPQSFDVVSAFIDDLTPPAFKYLSGSTRVNSAPVADPSVGRPLRFTLGTIPAWSDLDSNGAVDPGEPGFVLLTYQLVVGSGAVPGNHDNTVVARDFCATCDISNVDTARVRVALDPLFDLGTILGKVFEDRNGDGFQDPGELGVAEAMVALDDGTYALTDSHGRYHFPAVIPGNRLLKINLQSLPPGSRATTHRRRVVTVTPGLLARANFGVQVHHDLETIGKPAELGLALRPESVETPVEVQGNTETLTLLINGTAVPLESRGVRLGLDALDDRIHIQGGALEGEPGFAVRGEALDQVDRWQLVIATPAGIPVRTIRGEGPPDERISWDARDEDGVLVPAGELYHYWLELDYSDGARAVSERRMLGVNRTSVVSLTLTGNAFATGESALSPGARTALAEAADVLRRFPEESVVIEGHTDSVGTTSFNVALSQRRAESARTFLVDELGLSGGRFSLRALGEEDPVATNAIAEGRAMNRRVEVRGEFNEVDEAELLDVPRSSPRAEIDGDALVPDELGRFRTTVEDPTLSRLAVDLSDTQGRSVRAAVAVPTIAIDHPDRPMLVTYGEQASGCRADDGGTTLTCEVAGRTEPQNSVTLDGAALDVTPEGRFEFTARLPVGRSTFALLARNPGGVTRFANLYLVVEDRDDDGKLLVAAEPIPNLTVALPPAGVRLQARTLELSGATDPGNTVRINGETVGLDAQGRFSESVELTAGSSRLKIEAEDPEGRIGTIEREVEVAKHQLFLLAFADGKVGQFKAEGALAEQRVDDSEDLFTEGRLAFYLKGKIAGKYLITAAMDTGIQELEPLFGDLDDEQTRQLLTNLDPDRNYPVYGDGSTVVNDVETRGRFYLALEGETIQAVVGNYPLQLTDAELARYQRTLYGARFAYRSASVTAQGRPDTEVVLFAADIEQEHVQDELRATGGSLYYLSHRDVIEGSEQLTLVTRDETSGLVLERRIQRRDVDYTIKYPEGRVVFNRPISSVAFDTTPTSQSILAGNPVFLQVDYESRVPGFGKTASGGRVRQQIGNRVSVGGTYIQDELEAGSYELEAFDVELRTGENSRVVAEVANSSGRDSRIFVSDDGGLTYNEVAPAGSQDGSAWKVAAELDIGEWFGSPGRHELNLYVKELDAGFFSGGNAREQGTLKTGAIGRFKLTERDTIELRYEREERSISGPALPGLSAEIDTDSLLWRHVRKRWKLDVELFSNETRDAAGNVLGSSDLGAARFTSRFGDKLSVSVEHQQTLDGIANDQTGVGVQYQALPNLALDLKGTHGDKGTSAQAGAVLDLGEGSVYLAERATEQAGRRTDSTVFGVRAPIGEATEVYTEYQLERSEDASRAVSLLGVQREWEPGEGFKIRVSGETGNVGSAAGSDKRTSLSTSLSFQNPEGLTAQTRNEVRLDRGTRDRTQWTSFNKLDYKLDPSMTLLAHHRFSKSEDQDTDQTEARLEERSIGFAYRPVNHDRFNLLAKYTRLLDHRPDSSTGVPGLDRTMDVLAVESAFQFRKRVEWVAKIAGRNTQERFELRPEVEATSLLMIQRFNLELARPFDLGLEYRILTQDLADDRRQGWLGEVTWELHEYFRLGVGYNFTDFSDDEFSQNDASLYGWFLRVQGVY